MCNRAACVTNMEQENMEPEIKDLEIMEGEIVEEEKDPTLQFIEAVKEHKCIWDMQSEEYYNKEMYREAWKSLIPPSEYPMPEKAPDDSQQEADIKEKVAELKAVWVELRDSYYKNQDPGKKYKDSLRFLHSVYQSREMEAVLEFDEPSWDLMDLRTWTVLKTRIPRCKRSTDPAPEYEKAKYNKKPKICTNEAKKPDNVTGKENGNVKENITFIENATSKDNATNKKKFSSKKNKVVTENASNNDNATDTRNTGNTENATGKEKATFKVKANKKKDVTYQENAKSKEKTADKDNVTDKHITTGSRKVTVKVTAPKKKRKWRDEHQLTILEKAMRLYELENPGVWSSDEDETEKASRTYVDNSSQTATKRSMESLLRLDM